MTVDVRECPKCRERTPHEGRRGLRVLLLALPLLALAGAVWVFAAGSRGIGLLMAFPAAMALLYLREQSWRFLECARCRERGRRAYWAAKPRLTEIDPF